MIIITGHQTLRQKSFSLLVLWNWEELICLGQLSIMLYTKRNTENIVISYSAHNNTTIVEVIYLHAIIMGPNKRSTVSRT